jgi:hypothetical protein
MEQNIFLNSKIVSVPLIFTLAFILINFSYANEALNHELFNNIQELKVGE